MHHYGFWMVEVVLHTLAVVELEVQCWGEIFSEAFQNFQKHCNCEVWVVGILKEIETAKCPLSMKRWPRMCNCTHQMGAQFDNRLTTLSLPSCPRNVGLLIVHAIYYQCQILGGRFSGLVPVQVVLASFLPGHLGSIEKIHD